MKRGAGFTPELAWNLPPAPLRLSSGSLDAHGRPQTRMAHRCQLKTILTVCDLSLATMDGLTTTVTPAQAGDQIQQRDWIPAFAGMTTPKDSKVIRALFGLWHREIMKIHLKLTRMRMAGLAPRPSRLGSRQACGAKNSHRFAKVSPPCLKGMRILPGQASPRQKGFIVCVCLCVSVANLFTIRG